MKKQIPPAVVGGVIAVVVLVVVYFAWKTMVAVPEYPGLNAPQASKPKGDGNSSSGAGGGTIQKPSSPDEARKMGIPGAIPSNNR